MKILVRGKIWSGRTKFGIRKWSGSIKIGPALQERFVGTSTPLCGVTQCIFLLDFMLHSVSAAYISGGALYGLDKRV